ncbi:hypothetical protein ABIE65_004751 [Constrictibacter sp. MBR-5]|jgi:hypothetical protein|uniref:DeoR family transcriptional regulator n=1 Tax=Constrictibacter sp. MBR-5 TaxID=3156467 RepID=UPI0033953F9A
MFPKKGKVLLGRHDRENGSTDFAAIIAAALQTELGNSHRATKTVMRWTGASERTVKHWLAGRHAPGGEYLIVIMRESDAVFETVLAAAGRRDAMIAARMLAAQGTMVEVMTMIERERERSVYETSWAADSDGAGGPRTADDRVNDPINDRVCDAVSLPLDNLNPRQHWYRQALASGRDVRTADLQRRWGVSEKTARRDVAILKARGMIEFVGSFKTGRYRLRQ